MTPKELHELSVQRGAKAKELAALLNKQTLTDSERTEITNRRSELSGIDDRIARGTEALAIASSRPVAPTESEERDLNQFDLGRLLRGMLSNLKGNGSRMDGIEAEMAQEGEKEARDAGITELPGIQLPRMLVRRQSREARRFAAEHGRERRTSLTATGTTSVTGDQGGMTVASSPIGLLDDFYNQLVLEPYITLLEGLRGNVTFPRYAKDSDPAHKSENASAGALSATTAALSLSPHRLPAYQDISEQLLMQSSATIEAVVRSNITAQLAAEIQSKWINGSGVSNEPAGILSSSYTLSTVYAGGVSANGTNADGSAQVYRDWTRLRTKVAANNALAGRLAYLTNSQVVGQAFETKRGLATPADTVSTDSRMIIDDPATMRVAGFPVLETNSVPNSLTKGASSGILSANIFANWKDFYGAFWSGINLELLRDATIGIQGLYRLSASVYYDGGIVRPKSFAKCIDINAP